MSKRFFYTEENRVEIKLDSNNSSAKLSGRYYDYYERVQYHGEYKQEYSHTECSL